MSSFFLRKVDSFFYSNQDVLNKNNLDSTEYY